VRGANIRGIKQQKWLWHVKERNGRSNLVLDKRAFLKTNI
jgi:hypothetical protein